VTAASLPDFASNRWSVEFFLAGFIHNAGPPASGFPAGKQNGAGW
jgi:hypothetical protein